MPAKPNGLSLADTGLIGEAKMKADARGNITSATQTPGHVQRSQAQVWNFGQPVHASLGHDSRRCSELSIK